MKAIVATQSIRAGCEAEFTLIDKHSGNPVDVMEAIGQPKRGTEAFEELTRDMGVSQGEITSMPSCSEQDLLVSMRRMEQLLPKGTKPLYIPRAPAYVAVAEKPRTKAMHAALSAMHPNGRQCIETVAQWNAAQIHVSPPEGSSVYSDEAVGLVGVLNNIAPDMRLRFNKIARITGDDGHLNIWSAERFLPAYIPAPRMFRGIRHYEEFVGQQPRIIIETEDGKWLSGDGKTMMDLRRRDSAGTLWWLVRISYHKTIEIRPFAACTLPWVAYLGGQMLIVARAYYEYIHGRPQFLAEMRESGEDVDPCDMPELCRLLEALSAKSPLISERPLSRKEWWELYVL